MLTLLRGRIHHVYSGLCLWTRPADTVQVRVDTTKLKMAAISDQEMEAYIDSDGWIGKAGAFGFQDRPDWLEILTGSESNVIGLPLELLQRMLSNPG
jgi:septum formation protein